MRKDVQDVMTSNPKCCTPEAALQDVARLMVENDCGCIPVVDGNESMKPIGTITDRDIVCRTVAEGKNPLELTANEALTSHCVTIPRTAKLEQCLDLMEQNRIRRILVTDDFGRCCGIISQADIALSVDKKKTGEVVQEVSQHV